MCRAIPGKIVSIDNANPELIMAKVSFAGILKDICLNWVPESKVGEYVIAHVGFALNTINEQDAEDTLELLRQMGEI
ncbi:MAG: HypC/HybG/HupF family hydrogenase formation chaperone [Bacteroidales bacterium]